MKALLFILVLGISSVSMACTDFSGEYYDEEDGTYFAISQNACESIDYIYDEGTVSIAADGKEYLINQYDIVVEEGKVLATVEVYQSNKFVKEKLITTARSQTTYTSGSVDTEKGWSESTLAKNRDMVSIVHNSNGSIEKAINKRVK